MLDINFLSECEYGYHRKDKICWTTSKKVCRTTLIDYEVKWMERSRASKYRRARTSEERRQDSGLIIEAEAWIPKWSGKYI